jgi:nucleotide-binding universal stress UspA family protein
MFNTIIIALDGSEGSLRALKYAQNLAEKYGSKLILLHAYPRTSDLHASGGHDRLLAERKSHAQKIIVTARKMLAGSSCQVEEDLLEGPAADAILSAAQSQNADLIVMGNRGMGAIKGMLFGSVATKITHHADCPVLVVR